MASNNIQLAQLQAQQVGTGNPDTDRHQLLTHQTRDTLAALVGSHSLLQYTAVAMNTSVARTRYNCIQVYLFLSSE